jgi:hypothetical protein
VPRTFFSAPDVLLVADNVIDTTQSYNDYKDKFMVTTTSEFQQRTKKNKTRHHSILPLQQYRSRQPKTGTRSFGISLFQLHTSTKLKS